MSTQTGKQIILLSRNSSNFEGERLDVELYSIIFIEFQSVLENISASSPWRRCWSISKQVYAHFLLCTLKKLQDFSFSLICHSVSNQHTFSSTPLHAPWLGICCNIKLLSSKGHMHPLVWGCIRLLPVKHFLGSCVGIAVFDLCYLDYNGAAEEDPLLLISSKHQQHTPSPSGLG